MNTWRILPPAMGEPEVEKRHLTCLFPGERLNKEVEAGVYRKRESCAGEGWYKTIIREKFKAGTIKK